MTRRLPWDRDGSGGPASTSAKKTTTTPITPSRKVATPPGASATPKPKVALTPHDPSKRRSARSNGLLGAKNGAGLSPSTSPPPQPPPEICMIEGLEKDDKYRMVEDEFFTVAGQFTAHLHAAEYQRLKTQTKTQNAETIKNICRPVVGSLTELARKRQEELLRKKKQREALRKAKKQVAVEYESGDETNMPWLGTSLQGLMDSLRKKEVPLMSLTRTDSKTRALTSFGGVMKPQRNRRAASQRIREIDEETESDSDDLDGPVQATVGDEVVRDGSHSKRLAQATKSASRGSVRHVAQLPKGITSATLSASTTSSNSAALQKTTTTTTTMLVNNENDDNDEDDDDDDIFTRFKNRSASARQRRRGTASKEEKTERRESGNIIPSFL